MATRAPKDHSKKKAILADSPELGRRLRPKDREKLVRPGGTARRYVIETDGGLDADFVRIDKLIHQRQFGAALEELQRLQPGDAAFSEFYGARKLDREMRVLSRIAAVYRRGGNQAKAQEFLERAVKINTGDDDAAGRVLALADDYFKEQVKKRADLLKDLLESVRKDVYSRFCEAKQNYRDASILNDARLRDHVASSHFVPIDWLRRHLDGGKGEGIPGKNPNWIDPRPEDWGLDLSAEVPPRPGAPVDFSGTYPAEFAVEATIRQSPERFQATLALPLLASRLRAHLDHYAVAKGFDVTGKRTAAAPLYRYRLLREQALARLDRVGLLEQKMIVLQESVDDFAQLVGAVERPLAEKQAELAALDKQIDAALQTLTALSAAEGELGTITDQLAQGVDDCDVEWWESLLSVVLFIALVAIGTAIGGLAGAGIGFLLAGGAGAALGVTIGTFVGFAAGALVAFEAIEALGWWDGREITCDNVEAAHSDFSAALGQVRHALSVGTSELMLATMERDVLQAEIAALSSQLESIYTDNETRHLNAATIQNILGIYEDTRRRLLDQATILARKMEESYWFEAGETWKADSGAAPTFIAESYDTVEGKGYGGRERLLKDIEALEYVRLTGRKLKSMQLTLPVSLRRHFPTTLLAVKAGMKAPFTLNMERMDRFYPGTYQHRIREVRLQVLVDGVPSAARGYLSCYGPSQIRFPDPGNKIRVDGKEILAERDLDIAKLCYKRAWQVGGRETMAFPELNSPRADARVQDLQKEERNFFEGLGMGVTWIVEVLPDQNIDPTRITDVLVVFQVEAEYDDHLRKALEKKRFINRDEVAAFSAKTMAERQKRLADLSAIEFDLPQTSLPYPTQEKKIKNLAVFVKPRSEHFIEGQATVTVQLGDGAPVQVSTDEQGRAATGASRHAGPDGGKLSQAFHGKSPVGRWKVSLDGLPDGTAMEDVDDLYLLVRYEYA